jgi:hypothetical protein
MFKFKKECDRVYSLHFDTQEELCKTFLRYQEFEESTNADFKGKKFTIKSFKKWYSKNLGNGKFSYLTDWAGFNISVDIIDQIHKMGIDDPNARDEFMHAISSLIKEENKGKSCYLIGLYGSGQYAAKTLCHELAHALFYLSKEYRAEIKKIFNTLPVDVQKKIEQNLVVIGYDKSCVIDEFQAYLIEDNFKYVWPENKPIELKNAHKKVKKIYNIKKKILNK